MSCDPIIRGLALDRARAIAADLRRPKGAREEALRIVRRLEADDEPAPGGPAWNDNDTLDQPGKEARRAL